MREISLLKGLTGYPQFVRMLDVIKDDNHKDKLIHCVFEYCPSTLGKFFAKQKHAGQRIPLERIQEMMKSLLTAIDIMHGKMILHRDIKPDNILLDYNCIPLNLFPLTLFRQFKTCWLWTCEKSFLYAKTQIQYNCLVMVPCSWNHPWIWGLSIGSGHLVSGMHLRRILHPQTNLPM